MSQGMCLQAAGSGQLPRDGSLQLSRVNPQLYLTDNKKAAVLPAFPGVPLHTHMPCTTAQRMAGSGHVALSPVMYSVWRGEDVLSLDATLTASADLLAESQC